MSEYLFSYGTLQNEPIQIKTFGRKLEGYADSLAGYKMGQVEIKDPAVVASTGLTHYNNIVFTGTNTDIIHGTVFTLTPGELKEADGYEATDDYERMPVTLSSGKTAWVYHYSQQ